MDHHAHPIAIRPTAPDELPVTSTLAGRRAAGGGRRAAGAGDGSTASRPALGERRPRPRRYSELGSAGTSTACSCRALIGTICSTASLVEASTTGAATPSS